MLLLVVYEPEKQEEEGETISEAITARIRESAVDHQQLFDHLWLVEAEQDVDWWTDHLAEDDSYPVRLLVVRVQGRINGLLPSELWDWINERAV